MTREASDLQGVADRQYAAVLSSHVLEHLADPLTALREWHRVLSPGGSLLLAVPDPTTTVDRRRPITTPAHLLDDLGRAEDDTTHIAEAIALFDYSRPERPVTGAEVAAMGANNQANRMVHHHVFDLPLIEASLRSVGFDVEWLLRVWPVHLLASARRVRKE